MSHIYFYSLLQRKTNKSLFCRTNLDDNLNKEKDTQKSFDELYFLYDKQLNGTPLGASKN